jgi:hypothetical protein
MQFKAEVPDLELQLTTLSGEEITLLPKITLNGKSVIDLSKTWKSLQDKIGDGKDKITGLEANAKQLEAIYEKDSDWWLDNFNAGVIGKILEYIGGEIGTVKKNGKN